MKDEDAEALANLLKQARVDLQIAQTLLSRGYHDEGMKVANGANNALHRFWTEYAETVEQEQLEMLAAQQHAEGQRVGVESPETTEELSGNMDHPS